VVVLGIVTVGSGLVLDMVVPGMDYVRSTMQQAHMVHAVAAILMVCLIGFHIYLGTVGVRGAYGAMRHGYVDEAWAREHHAYWHDDIQAGKIPAQRSTPPGSTLPAEPVRTT
jgi:formate dehydrogenase subunit gamma